jgi:RNA polymerase sigma-70 factor (ECF subfamily)
VKQPVQTRTDDEIATALHTGDETVLRDILRTTGAVVERALRGRFPTLAEADIEDVLSEALLRLWTARDQYDPKKSAIGTWFYVIARNVAIDLLRSRRTVPSAEQAAETGAPAAAPSPGNIRGSSESAYQAICEILGTFAEADRQIVLAYAHWGSQQDWSEALSRELGVSLGTLRTKRSRLMKKIRQELAERGILTEPEAVTGEPT